MISPDTIAHEACRLPAGLFYGKMGTCLYLANVDSTLAESCMLESGSKAQSLSEDIMRLNCDTSMRRGLCGVVTALGYLNRKGIGICDIGQLEQETDTLVFREISDCSYLQQLSISSLVEYTCYESWRLDKTNADDEAFYCHTELLKMLAQALVKALMPVSLIEPATYSLEYTAAQVLYAFSQVTKHGIYKEYMEKMLDELSPLFLYKMPIRHSNRLYLLWALSKLMEVCRPNDEWCGWLDMLKSHVSIDRVLDEVDGAIYLADGAASIYFLLKETRHLLSISQESMRNYAAAIHNILTNSREIKHLESNPAYLRSHLGLYEGFSGTALTKLIIERTYQL